jgi:hypothetical protein
MWTDFWAQFNPTRFPLYVFSVRVKDSLITGHDSGGGDWETAGPSQAAFFRLQANIGSTS